MWRIGDALSMEVARLGYQVDSGPSCLTCMERVFVDLNKSIYIVDTTEE